MIKEKLIKEVGRILDTDIKIFVLKALKEADENFWKVPASSSGRFHPIEDLGEGGSVRHVIKASRIAHHLSIVFSLSEIDRDIVIAASILHDIQKNGIPWGEATDGKHAFIAYEWLNKFELKEEYKTKLLSCVRYHMGRWSQPITESERASKPELMELIVQMSDYIASRKDISFLPDVELTKELIESYSK